MPGKLNGLVRVKAWSESRSHWGDPIQRNHLSFYELIKALWWTNSFFTLAYYWAYFHMHFWEFLPLYYHKGENYYASKSVCAAFCCVYSFWFLYQNSVQFAVIFDFRSKMREWNKGFTIIISLWSDSLKLNQTSEEKKDDWRFIWAAFTHVPDYIKFSTKMAMWEWNSCDRENKSETRQHYLIICVTL